MAISDLYGPFGPVIDEARAYNALNDAPPLALSLNSGATSSALNLPPNFGAERPMPTGYDGAGYNSPDTIPSAPPPQSPISEPPSSSPSRQSLRAPGTGYFGGSQGTSAFTPDLPVSTSNLDAINEEIKRRAGHHTPLWRSILGGVASLWAPGVGQQIVDPEAARFNRLEPLRAAGAKAELDAETRRSQIEQRRAAELNQQMIRAEAAYNQRIKEQELELNQQKLEEAKHKDEITETTPMSPTTVSLPPIQSPVPPEPASAAPGPLSPPIGPVDLMASNPNIATNPALAALRSTSTTAPAAEVPPDPRLAFKVSPKADQPAGTRQIKLTPQGVATEKRLAEQENWIPTPQFIRERFPNDKLPDRIPQAVLDAYIRADSAEADRQLRKYAVDETNATRRENAAMNADLRRELAANRPARQLPAPVQTKVAAADSTRASVDQAIEAIDQFTKAHPDMTGPLNFKRWTETKLGTEPEDIGAVDMALENIAALQPGQHNFRSLGALTDFKKSLGIDPRTGKPDGSRAWLVNPGKAKKALKEVSDFNKTLKRNAIRAAGLDPADFEDTEVPASSGAGITKPPQSGAKLTDPAVAAAYTQAAGGDKNKARELAKADGWTF